jgi:hypothetical protein
MLQEEWILRKRKRRMETDALSCTLPQQQEISGELLKSL